MGNGLPGMGEVSEPEEKKEEAEKKKFLNGWVDWSKISKAFIGLLVLVGGSFSGYQIYSERQPISSDTALAAEIATVKTDVVRVEGEALMCKAVTDTIDKRVTNLETTIKDVGKVQTDTATLTEKARNLEINVNDVKTTLKDVTARQEDLQKGINKILQKLK